MKSKLSCEEVLSKLMSYLDHEEDAGSESDIDEHLHECRECFSRAEFEKALKRKLAAAGEEKTPEEIRTRLEALVKRF